ncbi:ABC transporter ATP-binding protein/permease [Pseudomonas sp. Env-44]|jgi:putative ATP-binding cassette transporter|uniref:ABC transporter ATP-binding protein/permease n=1 Tax=Pseudomonas paracarnis TaxID=2750625 RepID=A0ABU6BLP2_9PSED|nr:MULTISPECIES: ABC transporter ATP-binding protein/permease [Pseudomonas]KWV74834.1 Vitamin B12 transport ATP-binding protein BacA [Pseudomonas fluorescens]MDN5595900.1 ABC transporter ATP-binding protein/permease [Pseudomonas sp.]MBJ2233807.1 ABC transporter ATP-binding protein/permease [Pseudomonas fluorescens]MBW9242864.1 ABC transporter ATP-binding protein/permease [Pseudomonas paracarnis]MCF5508365.1 ATP-binding cassette domain-containing protein [Pseudomonas sp. PA-3-6H]
MNQNAEYRAVNDAVRGQFFRRTWAMITPYWRSEEKGRAWLLLAAVIGLSLFSVAISVWINHWYKDFYNALEKKDTAAFWQLIGYFGGIAAVAILGAVYRLYLTQMLTIRWRAWLTEKHFSRWLAHKNYYQLEQGGYTDNPDQRISEDLNNFTSGTLSLGLGLLRNVVSLVSFSIILWGVSGSIEVFGVTIPGYMFWCALLYAAVGSWLTHLIGRRLIGLSNQQQRFEADLRFSMVRVRENAESIALYNGEPNERQRLSTRFGKVWQNFWDIMKVSKRLTFFTAGYSQIAIIFPFIVAAPRYFTGKIELGELMQINSAFGNVQENFSWFINAYSELATWRATSDRLLSFQQAMSDNEQRTPAIDVRPEGERLVIKDLGMDLADGRHLLTDADMTVEPGERVMLSGRSGSGKSTLLRAMGHLWPAGHGSIRLPATRYLFLPQKPYLPIGTLKAVLSYPQDDSVYPAERYAQVLETCRLPHLVNRLDEANHWQRMLSPGEQQRLAFARALLFAPRWLYMDEATSAMDEEDEATLYQALIDQLPGLSIVSVGHRSSLKRFHGRHVRIDGGRLQEQQPT